MQEFSIKPCKQMKNTSKRLSVMTKFIPDVNGWFNIYKSVNAIYHINRLRDKKHIIILLDTKMMLDKI